MNRWMAFLCGLNFAIGLCIAGMTQPGKITAFLDFAGSWDPSLLFVMAGAILVYSVGFRMAVKMPKPLFEQEFQIPPVRSVDKKLVLGAVIFGAGWGLAGFCPGPGMIALVSLRPEPLIFVASMLTGMWIFEKTQTR